MKGYISVKQRRLLQSLGDQEETQTSGLNKHVNSREAAAQPSGKSHELDSSCVSAPPFCLYLFKSQDITVVQGALVPFFKTSYTLHDPAPQT